MKKITLFLFTVLFSLNIYAQKEPFQGNATLPSVDLKTLDGQIFNTQSIDNDGKPIIISLWATWCMPCREELEAISIVYEDWTEETGVKLYAISIDDSRTASKVAPFVRSKGWEYVILQDINADFKRALNVTDVPYLCILNGNREIVWAHSSYAQGDEDEIFEIIKKLSTQEK